MQEMMKETTNRPTFGKLIMLNNGAEFLESIDKENKNVTVICHIYSNDIAGCEAMNGCLECLATEYVNVKFCAIEASSAGMSKHFVSAIISEYPFSISSLSKANSFLCSHFYTSHS